jgi:hypothetical protein
MHIPQSPHVFSWSHVRYAGQSETDGALAANAPLALSAWKGKASIAIMVEKAECAQMIDKVVSRLGVVFYTSLHLVCPL